jgi:ABC-type dipeptide/oligopeptide/nickel transport system ATPase subunit
MRPTHAEYPGFRCRARPITGKGNREQALEKAGSSRRVGLDDQIWRRGSAFLSGGQRQRVIIPGPIARSELFWPTNRRA